ncbi:enteropeptidase [Trichomycterus rosablanca]|uniref:enteropeptidase n=1 Tax=Trichomycterus rosablanca TaxID=2290929 RepID=UPI002F352D3F
MCTSRKKNWSSVEVLMSTLLVVLFIVCVGLIVVSWFALQPSNTDENGSSESSFSGTLKIVRGATFTEELRNKSSVQFKSLAFDTQLLVSEAFGRSALSQNFRSCRVTQFSQGSVLVNFDLMFGAQVEVMVVEQELISSLQDVTAGELVINTSSIHITVTCPVGERVCRDGETCVSINLFCDGEPNCPDGSDESHSTCATVCDGQFVLLGLSGFFHSGSVPQDYDSDLICRWIIRAGEGLVIRMEFEFFHPEESIGTLSLYEGTGPDKILTYSLTGSSPPGVVWIFSQNATVEFWSDSVSHRREFNATYRAESLAHLTNDEKINCSFEDGFCFWRRDADADGFWIRMSGSSLPSLSGPSHDHTYGNKSGFYIITPRSPGNWEKIFRINSLPLSPANQPVCLRFWYHMFGVDVWRLAVTTERNSSSTLLFHKEGNYGDNWNYGQITVNIIAMETIVFEARKRGGGMRNDIALDDLSLTSGPCGPSPPDPTPVPPPTTPPPMPPDCGGPFDLYEPNTTFSSPNYPRGYGDEASCLWTLHADEGQNIQLHFQDVALEALYDVLEVRDGVEPHSTLLGVLTGEFDFPDLFSTSSQMTVMFFSDSSGNDRGFLANFTTGFNLGRPETCDRDQYQCRSGRCVSSSSVCDGVVQCPDSSDEVNCVHLMSVNFTEAPRLKIQMQNILHQACGTNWDSQLSQFFCRYLGYRSGNASFLSVLENEDSFVLVNLSSDGALDLIVSETCSSETVVSLHCDNQPCGRQKLGVRTGSSRSVMDELMVKDGGRIVGGEDAVRGSWPWMVSLHWRGRHACGGTLIDSRWIVTAAHCVYGKNVHLWNWDVILGLHAQYELDTSERQTHEVDRIIMNPNYNKRTKESDVALLHLHTSVNYTDYIQPICLPDPDQHFTAGRRCIIAGWGRLSEGGSVADVLQQAVVPLINNSLCQHFLPEYTITDRMVCAGYTEGGIDSCQGDSGGPLVCEQDDFWVLAGVTSFGAGCAQPRRPGVYALVPHYVRWIVETRRLESRWHGGR